MTEDLDKRKTTGMETYIIKNSPKIPKEGELF